MGHLQITSRLSGGDGFEDFLTLFHKKIMSVTILLQGGRGAEKVVFFVT